MVDRVTRALEGRLSLDMLIGLSIFLVTIIFISQFLPTVFADVRSEIGLAHEAYKVTVMLAEVEGAWSNGTHNGTNWENFDICNICSVFPSFVFLPGLSEGKPDFLSLEKTLAFNRYANQCPNVFRRMLGLDTSNTHFHVSIESLYSTPYERYLVKYNNSPLLDAGEPILPGGNIMKFERYIWLKPNPMLIGVLEVDTRKGAVPTPICKEETGGFNCTLTLTYPLTEFFIIVNNIYQNSGSPAVSFCISKEQKPGACPIGTGIKVEVENNSNTLNGDIPPQDELPSVIKEIDNTTIVDFINSKLSNEGVQSGDEIYIRASFRHVNVSWIALERTSPYYIAGKAAAKLVVYVW